MARDAEAMAVLTIAGSDPSGGAGAQMDLKCFAAAGVHGLCALTAVTVQNTTRLGALHPVPAAVVKEQLDAAYEDFRVEAVKTGMLYEASIAETVADKVAEEGTKLVVDPVLSASVGATLSKPDLVAAFRQRLLPKAFLVTPNLPEAGELLGKRMKGEEDMRRACRELHDLGCQNVLLKGGHLPGGPALDILYDGRFIALEAPRLGVKAHGTGCMLSAFITAYLAQGIPLEQSVRQAKERVSEALQYATRPGRGLAIADPLNGLHNASHRYTVMMEVHRRAGELAEALPVSLVPEVGVDMAFALPFAARPEDVCALEGRLVRAGRKTLRAGFPAFGTYGELSAVVLAAMVHDRRVRCALNIRYSVQLVELAPTMGFKVGVIARNGDAKEPFTLGGGALRTMDGLGFVPDLLCDEGGHGQEPAVLVMGEEPSAVLDKVRALVRGLGDERKA